MKLWHRLAIALLAALAQAFLVIENLWLMSDLQLALLCLLTALVAYAVAPDVAALLRSEQR